MKRSTLAVALFLLAALKLHAFADPIPDGGVGQNVTVVGYSNLDDRPGFKMSIVETNGRWYPISVIYGTLDGRSLMSPSLPTPRC
ncbi:MAG: hypothetical protein WAM77_28120 [Xanthobacteraceae bacterium]